MLASALMRALALTLALRCKGTESGFEQSLGVSRLENQQVRCPSSPYSCIGAWNNCSQVLLTKGRVNVAVDQSIEYEPTLAGLGT